MVVINKEDNVSVATEPLQKGQNINIKGENIVLKDNISPGHKFAICNIKKGNNVVKYGYPIGYATCEIKEGEHVHSHNLSSNLGKILEYEYNPNFSEVEKVEKKVFMGYRREDGRVGIRNEIWIIPTVGCVNSIVRQIEEKAKAYVLDNIDGIYSYNHPYGCSQLGDDMNNTLKFLSSLAHHPNSSGVLFVGLGCENGNINELKKVLGKYDEKKVKFLVCQKVENEIDEGINIVKELVEDAKKEKRTECSASELVIGLKCGGSDGFSGLTANPLLGSFSDKLIGMGGSTILTEVPEMFGAETILMNRCRNEKVYNGTVNLINNFKKYFMRYGEKIDENPSPGNKEGGITTLEEKSLGCTQKAGTAPVEDVLLYGDIVRKKGLSLLQAPGNDLVASNALAASGAHMVLFTTGRGTPFGCPVPTVKISSNTTLYKRKSNWIDFDAGVLLDEKNMEKLTSEFIDYILDVASGIKLPKSEKIESHELAIFKDGVTL